jgi:type I site-specific restriction endonuclease
MILSMSFVISEAMIVEETRINRIEDDLRSLKEYYEELRDFVNEINTKQEKNNIIIESIKNNLDRISDLITISNREYVDFKVNYTRETGILTQLANDIFVIKQELQERKSNNKKLVYKIIGTVVSGVVLTILGFIVSKLNIL